MSNGDVIAQRRERAATEAPRKHMGASSIGHPCSRKIWYQYRWCRSPYYEETTRMKNIFELGHAVEAIVVNNLSQTIEIKVEHDGKPIRVSMFGGHFAGTLDGICVPPGAHEWAVLEIKSANQARFNEMKQFGIPASSSIYHSQIQAYMHLTGLRLTYFVVVNKNTSEGYTETISYNEELANAIIDRAESILRSATPPQRVSSSPSYYLCKHCEFAGICHVAHSPGQLRYMPEPTCRTCCSSYPDLETSTHTNSQRWTCDKGHTITPELERDGCKDHCPAFGTMPLQYLDGDETTRRYKVGRNSIQVGGPFSSFEFFRNCANEDGFERALVDEKFLQIWEMQGLSQ